MFLPKKAKKILISAEWLSGNPSIEGNQELRFQIVDRLKLMYPNAGIILGFREKRGWIISAYSQYVKNGGVKNFSYWKNHIFNESSLKFAEYEDYIRKKFKRVYIYSFEELKQNPDKVITEICYFIGEPVPNWNKKIYNKKFPPHKLFVTRQINKLCKSYYNPRGILPIRLVSIIKRISGSWG